VHEVAKKPATPGRLLRSWSAWHCSRSALSLALLLTLCVLLADPGIAPAQIRPVPPPIGDPTGRSGEPPPLQREEPRPLPPPVQILPPVPTPRPAERQLLPTSRVFVREIRVVGSTVFSREELAALTGPYTNREVTSEDLESLRLALTRLYVDRGYINSGAVLPDQPVTDGVIIYDVIEGTLTGIQVEGNQWLWPSYYRRRLSLGAGPPLNINELREQIQYLLEDPRIERLNASLNPGARLGEAVLNIRTEERLPFRAFLDIDNYQNPSVGSVRGLITLEHQSLTGNGDVLTVQYGKSEGLGPLLDLRYAFPITARDTIASFEYRRNDFTVIEKPFDELNIESDSEIYTLTVRHPVYRTPNTRVFLELTGERLSHTTTLLGEPFTLEPGAVNGEAVSSAIRVAQELIYRTQNQVFAARSRFSVGVDVLGATIHQDHNVPDSRFFAWLGQMQWVRRLDFLERFGLGETQAIAKTDLQFANDPLLALEQVAIGGRYSVRGYRETTLLRDNAFLGSVELRIPVLQNLPFADYLQIAPFYDYGRGWNNGSATGDRPSDISSIGVGLRWALTLHSQVPVRPQFEIYWGHPFRRVKTAGGDPQDDGIHFQFVLGFN
jgi:hemolysin activation/secretion protein